MRIGQGIFILKKKYVMDLIKVYDLIIARPLGLPLDTHMKITLNQVLLFLKVINTKGLVGKHIYDKT